MREGTSYRQEVGGLPLASATVFSTSAADYKQKKERKEKKALPSVNNRKSTEEKKTEKQRVPLGPLVSDF